MKGINMDFSTVGYHLFAEFQDTRAFPAVEREVPPFQQQSQENAMAIVPVSDQRTPQQPLWQFFNRAAVQLRNGLESVSSYFPSMSTSMRAITLSSVETQVVSTIKPIEDLEQAYSYLGIEEAERHNIDVITDKKDQAIQVLKQKIKDAKKISGGVHAQTLNGFIEKFESAYDMILCELSKGDL